MPDTPTIESLAVAAARDLCGWELCANGGEDPGGYWRVPAGEGLGHRHLGSDEHPSEPLLDESYGGALLFYALLRWMDGEGIDYRVGSGCAGLYGSGGVWHNAEARRHDDDGPLPALLLALHAAGRLEVDDE